MFQAISEYMGKPFWEQPLSMWDTVNNVGLRWKLNSKTVEMNWTYKKNPSSFVIVYCEFNCKCTVKDHTLCFWKAYVPHTNMVPKIHVVLLPSVFRYTSLLFSSSKLYRNHYMCTVYAAKMMVPRKSGLIVNISSAGGLAYLFNVAYGIGKEAVSPCC